jgi:hypothetical protein
MASKAFLKVAIQPVLTVSQAAFPSKLKQFGLLKG